MPFSPHRSNSGFTIIEMLIVIPVIILLIGVLIGFISILTGDSIQLSAKNGLAYDGRQALDTLEQDVHLATAFRATGFTPTSPQGSASDGTAWNAITNQAIILRSVATTKNPLDPTRDIVYKKNTDGSCSTDPYLYDIVYYFTKDTDDNEYHMWRRVVFDSASQPCTGTTPWQRSTCAPGVSGTPCQAKDVDLADNITARRWYYADIPDATTTYPEDWIHGYNDGVSPCNVAYNSSSPIQACLDHAYDPNTKDGTTNAKSLYLEITMSKQVAGETVSTTSHLYSTRLNAPSSSS